MTESISQFSAEVIADLGKLLLSSPHASIYIGYRWETFADLGVEELRRSRSDAMRLATSTTRAQTS